MLSTFDGQLVEGVMVDHLGDALKGLAELAQDEFPIFVVHYLHVHEATCALQGE